MSVGQNSMRRLHNAFCALVYIYLLAPIVVVVGASFNAGNFLTFPPRCMASTRTGSWPRAA